MWLSEEEADFLAGRASLGSGKSVCHHLRRNQAVCDNNLAVEA